MIHIRVPLPYKVEDGMGDFLSPGALKVIAEDYQQGLLDRLNEQIKGNVSVSYICTNLRIYWVWAGEGRYQP
jgi:Fe-Mn family superoxide dismutase